MQKIEVTIPRADVRWGAALGLLQAGFFMLAREGMSAREFMRDILAFPDPYIEGVVSTVFLDDSPVDDIDATRLAEGSRIALSAAMPGLVGAVMRRNSPYAALRESISYKKDGAAAMSAVERPPEIRVGVKLFNSVMRDRGPELLARGIYLRGEAAEEALRSLEVEARATSGEKVRAGSAKEAATSMPLAAPSSEIFLRIVEAQL